MRESDYGDPATSAQTTAAASAVSMEHIAMIRGSDDPGRSGRPGQCGPGQRAAATSRIQVTPNPSVSMPKPGLQADAASGSTMVAPTESAAQ